MFNLHKNYGADEVEKVYQVITQMVDWYNFGNREIKRFYQLEEFLNEIRCLSKAFYINVMWDEEMELINFTFKDYQPSGGISFEVYSSKDSTSGETNIKLRIFFTPEYCASTANLIQILKLIQTFDLDYSDN